MKTWSPDTCGCTVEEIYEGTEIIGGGKVIKKCNVHSSVPDNELYGVLYSNPDGENKRKNLVHRILLGHDNPSFGLEKKEMKDGQESVSLKEGVEYEWSFEGTGKNRVLNVSVKGAVLTEKHKSDFKDLCDAKFGRDKVKVK